MGNAATTRPSQDHIEKGGKPDNGPLDDGFFRRSEPDPRMAKKKCCKSGCCGAGCCGGLWWLKTIYLVLALVVAIVALAVITSSVTAGIATQIYSSDLSGRLVGLIILAVSAAGTITALIVGALAVFKKKQKALIVTSIVLLILAVIQSIIAGVSVRVTQNDESILSRSLIESFRLAREDNPRHVRMWSATQHAFDCCGVYSAEDYRRPGVPPYFPPDVAISCCPSYDRNRPDLVQERNREFCKSRGEYYRDGCKGPVLTAFKDSSVWVLSVIIILIILEVTEASLGGFLILKKVHDPNPKPPNPEDGSKKKKPIHDTPEDGSKKKKPNHEDGPKPPEKDKHKENGKK